MLSEATGRAATLAAEPDAQAPAGDAALVAARAFVSRVAETDRALRRVGLTISPTDVKEEVAAAFWALVAALERCDRELPAAEARATGTACRDLVAPWLLRSRFFNRSATKPHGYAGDFRMLEWMYDLEGDPCADPTQPGIVNCLDHLFATVHSVRSVWERRRWFAELLRREHAHRGGRLRVLDVACGGARYTRDFLSGAGDTSGIALTLVDQDAAALAFCAGTALARCGERLVTISTPVQRLPQALPVGDFDVVISTGLFDYLTDELARQLLAHMAALTTPGGIVAISNFAPEDPSRLVKDWLVDWPLIYRDEAMVAALFPGDGLVRSDRSTNGALVYGWSRPHP